MTPSPDVQNVPDVWWLLEQAGDYLKLNSKGSRGDELRQHLADALSQRDRFVLVPKESTQEIRTALAQAYFFDPNDAFVDKMVFVWAAGLAAAPKPEQKP